MKNQLFLAEALKYLIALDDHALIAYAVVIAREGSDDKVAKVHANIINIAEIQQLIAVDENITALEMMLYGYRQLLNKTSMVSNVPVAIVNANLAAYIPEVIEYIGKVRKVLEQWHSDPKHTDTIVALLTKTYKKQIDMLTELLQASTNAITQLTNFGIILSSQLLTIKHLAKKNEVQPINDVLKLEQTAISKIFPTLIKKLKHDQEIFYSKHRFMEEEFKFFLRERQELIQDPTHSELSAANIYDTLKRIQYDIAREVKFRGNNA